MSRSPRSRLVGSALLLSAVAISVMTSPVSASGRTRWVDDDGNAGTAGCSGTKTAYKTIQKAINASGAGDTVKVCPGTYVGSVTIKGARTGLVLRSVTTHGATIKAVDEFDAGTTYLVTIDHVDKVTVKGFKIRALRSTSHSYCSWSTGIRAITSTTLSLAGNDIRPSGSGAFCGVDGGILASGGSTGTIADNAVKDYRTNGIELTGPSTRLTIQDNSITFAHVGLPSITGDSGILLDNGADGTVKGNTITGPAAGAGNPSQPAAGVRLDGTGSTTSVRSNTIARFASDIKVQHANGGTIHDNTVSGGQVGLDLLDGDGMTVYANTTTAATVHGLYVTGPAGGAGSDASKSTGNTVHDNDFRTNSNGALEDCKGESSATVAVSNANIFTDDLGNSSDPAALCDGGSVPK